MEDMDFVSFRLINILKHLFILIPLFKYRCRVKDYPFTIRRNLTELLRDDDTTMHALVASRPRYKYRFIA